MEEKFDPNSEWKGMPEFVQDKQKPYAMINVRFDSEEALQEFATLIGQKLNRKTKSIWHPYKSHWGQSPKVCYVDEELFPKVENES